MGIRKIDIVENKKSKIQINDQNVVKTLKVKSVTEPKKWIKHYHNLCKNNRFLVEVYDIDSEGKTITMEKLKILTTVEIFLKDEDFFHLVNKNILCDILYAVNFSWAQCMEYSKTLQEDLYILNTDVSLHNMVITEDKSVKILDPESYDILYTVPNYCWAFDFSEKYYMTQINLMSKIQKFNYVQIP